jgi:hypothetical protein
VPEAVCVRVAVTVREEVDDPVDVLEFVDVFVSVEEVVEVLELVDDFVEVALVVDVREGRDVRVEVFDGKVEEVAFAERVDVRVELEELVGNAPAPIKTLC